MYNVGIDIGGTNIKIGLVDEMGKLVAKTKFPFEKKSYEFVCTQMADAVYTLVKEMQVSARGLSAKACGDKKTCEIIYASMNELINSIGIAVPGSVDVVRGVVINAYNLDFFNVPLKEEMQKHFPDIDIYLANDADAAALAELHAGVFVGKQTAVLITIGTGTGGGLIIGGKMHSGGNGRGCELGHMSLRYGGAPCTCGNSGCIESYCSATWLKEAGVKAGLSPEKDAVSSGFEADRLIDAKAVIDLAKSGNKTALAIFDEFVDNLSSAIASICSLLDPEIVALGGGVSEAGEFLYEPLKVKVSEKNFFKADYEIVPAALGNDAGMIGAAFLVSN